jgi:hypothetical protein
VIRDSDTARFSPSLTLRVTKITEVILNTFQRHKGFPLEMQSKETTVDTDQRRFLLRQAVVKGDLQYGNDFFPNNKRLRCCEMPGLSDPRRPKTTHFMKNNAQNKRLPETRDRDGAIGLSLCRYFLIQQRSKYRATRTTADRRTER